MVELQRNDSDTSTCSYSLYVCTIITPTKMITPQLLTWMKESYSVTGLGIRSVRLHVLVLITTPTG
jgi:hypothetical protein